MSIELTTTAANELRKVMQEQGLNSQEQCLYVQVRCFGPQRSFALDLIDRQGWNGAFFESCGIQITCETKDLRQLDGIIIDFQDQWGARGFVFNQPARKRVVRAGPTDPSQPPPEEQQVRQALRNVIDPELGVNILDLGLVYGIAIAERTVRITMTMTTPACPLSEQIKADVNDRILQHCTGAGDVEVEIVWEPRWTQEMITPEGKKSLGWSR